MGKPMQKSGLAPKHLANQQQRGPEPRTSHTKAKLFADVKPGDVETCLTKAYTTFSDAL